MKKPLLLFLIAGTLIMMMVMAKTGASLKTPLTTLGILNLEFAYNPTMASEVINVWTGMSSADNIGAAKFNTKLDFIFLSFYSLLLFYLCRLAAKSAAGYLYSTGILLAKGSIIAGLLDILENTGMLLELNGHITSSITFFTFICASLKWALVLAAVLYILINGSIILYKNALTHS